MLWMVSLAVPRVARVSAWVSNADAFCVSEVAWLSRGDRGSLDAVLHQNSWADGCLRVGVETQ